MKELITRRGWLAWVILAVAVFVLSGCGKSGEAKGTGSNGTATEKPPATQAIEISGHKFELELALDDDEREQGLSDRKEIAEDGGMLFVFSQPRKASFVMRRCYVPIDLVYLDDDGYIDSIHRMTVIEPVGGPLWNNPTRGYTSAGAVQFALEFKGGTLDKLGLRRGDKIELPYKKLESMAE